MNRISIDVTPEQHQRLKALAALQGKSIKQFVLESTLGTDASSGLVKLEALLDERSREARKRPRSRKTVGDIFKSARKRLAADKRG